LIRPCGQCERYVCLPDGHISVLPVTCATCLLTRTRDATALMATAIAGATIREITTGTRVPAAPRVIISAAGITAWADDCQEERLRLAEQELMDAVPDNALLTAGPDATHAYELWVTARTRFVHSGEEADKLAMLSHVRTDSHELVKVAPPPQPPSPRIRVTSTGLLIRVPRLPTMSSYWIIPMAFIALVTILYAITLIMAAT
jgi:hypothetical protein